MSQLSEKELQLMAAVLTNFNGSINTLVNWEQAALDAGYKDDKNARVMWGRLAKKLVDIAGARGAKGDNDAAGEGSADAPATANKKRKAAAGPAQADSSTAKVDRPTKKTKGHGGSAQRSE